MQVTPALKVDDLNQLQPGELFLSDFGAQRFVGLVCLRDTLKLVLTIGPKYPNLYGAASSGPMLVRIGSAATVISFERNFGIKLPSGPGAWTTQRERDVELALALTATGVFFLLADEPAWVEISSGLVTVQQPGELRAYATSWEIVTVESASDDFELSVSIRR